MIIALEVGLLNPEIRGSKSQLNALIDKDFLEIGQTGILYDKEQVIHALINQTNNPRDSVLAEAFAVEWLADDLALLTYQSSHPHDADIKKCVRTSIWKKRGNNWVLRFHQGTPVRQTL